MNSEKIKKVWYKIMSVKIKGKKIFYTKVDEAPALATYSLLPIIRIFTDEIGIDIETKDISLAGRIIANFPNYLTVAQRIPNDLENLGKLIQKTGANIIKLPSISASIHQMKKAIKELQELGYCIPNYPEYPQTDKEIKIKNVYDKIKGSAVNPILRQGNSDRRIPFVAKKYAQNNPHNIGKWLPSSKSHVAHMASGDLASNEKSKTISKNNAGVCKIKFIDHQNNVTILKDKLVLTEGEIIDGSVMCVKALRLFLEQQIKEAKKKSLLFSVHLKATMMKELDTVIFGHVVSVFFKDVFNKNDKIFAELGIIPSNGLTSLYHIIKTLPEAQRKEIENDVKKVYLKNPKLAMVDSCEGITNLHTSSDIIIDASMPAAILNSGKMWGPDGKLHDSIFVIPDSSYTCIYKEIIAFCKREGKFNPCTMGSLSNVGLMAQKAEEYGSNDKTFIAPENGRIIVVSESGNTLLTHEVEKNDIWRMCQVQDISIQDWVRLAVLRTRKTGKPAVFWLNRHRPHDREIIKKVNKYIEKYDINGLQIHIMSQVKASHFTIDRLKRGEDTIAVTGNVLRDYLTDLFPILEVGTSANALSIVPLMQGGKLFETGAGGTAPKHVQQFTKENHLRWNSLGEFLALSASLEHLSKKINDPKAKIMAMTLDIAIEKLLTRNKIPSKKVKELDNRGTHFYLALFWAEALANQTEFADLKTKFSKLHKSLQDDRAQIVKELARVQGKPVDIGGYYKPDEFKALNAMRPSPTFNKIITLFTSKPII